MATKGFRIPVDPTQLHGDVARAKVPFFKHDHGNALDFALLNGGVMVEARLPKQHNTIYFVNL